MAYTSISVLTEESIEYLSRTPDESIVGKVPPGLTTAILFVIGAFLNLLLIKVVSWVTPADSPIGHACASHPPSPTASRLETGSGSSSSSRNSGFSTTTTENSSLLLDPQSRCHSHTGLAIGGDNRQRYQASSDSVVVSNLHGTKCQSGGRCEYACTDRECYHFEHCHITPLFPHTHTHTDTHAHSHTKSSSHSPNNHNRPSLQSNGSDNDNNSTAHISSQHQRLLVHVGLQTAVAIALHKIPEGLIIYLSRQASPKLGLSVAASLFFHNLPEGLMLALPLFLATGRRHMAFMLSSLMGAAPPAIGAALGMLLLGGGSSNGDDAPDRSSHERFAGMFGIAFGITAGMMCMVSLNGMLPTARIYDKSGNVVSWCFAMGVAAMVFANSVFK